MAITEVKSTIVCVIDVDISDFAQLGPAVSRLSHVK